ncbi:MAG: SCO family protein [Adhaeribacter sp.]
MKNSLIYYLLFLLAVSCASLLAGGCQQPGPGASSEAARAPLHPESLYQFTGQWEDQHGDTLQLSRFQGKIPVVAMVFTNCAYACGRIVGDIKNIEKQVPADKRKDVVFVLVSFDSERDSPEKLREFAEKMELDERWTLLHGDEEAVRELSMLLNVKYKKQPNGDYAHTNTVTLLDARGLITARLEGLGVDPKPLTDALAGL